MQTDLLGKWDYLGILFGGKDSVLFCNLHFVHLRLGGVGYGGVLKEERGREAESRRADVQSLEHCPHCHLCCHQCHQLSYLSSLLSSIIIFVIFVVIKYHIIQMADIILCWVFWIIGGQVDAEAGGGGGGQGQGEHQVPRVPANKMWEELWEESTAKEDQNYQ